MREILFHSTHVALFGRAVLSRSYENHLLLWRVSERIRRVAPWRGSDGRISRSFERYGSRARPLARCPRRFNVAMFQRSARCRFIYARLASPRNIRRVPGAKFVPARQIIAHDQSEFSLLCDFSKPARLSGYYNLGEANVSWAYRLPHGIVPRRHKQTLWVFADRLPSAHARNDAVENEHFAGGRTGRVRETYLKRVRKRERSFSRCRSA